MKAVIVEIQSKYVAALDDSGIFHKLPNKGYELGQTIELPEVNTNSYIKRVAVAASIALVVLVGGNLAFGTLGLNEDSKPALQQKADTNQPGIVSEEDYNQIKDGVKEQIDEQVQQSQENWEENGDDWNDTLNEFNEWGRKITDDLLEKLNIK